MIIKVIEGSPENLTFLSGNGARLAGMNFKTTNLFLFKVTRGYWLIDEMNGNQVVDHHKVLFEVEIKPFWKFNKY